MRFSVQPHDYAMNLQAMTKEKLQFLLPVVFTVGPDVGSRTGNPIPIPGLEDEPDLAPRQAQENGDDDPLKKYAILLADSRTSPKSDNSRQFVENIVKGIIEGETRVLVSSMTMEEIFSEREVFKRRIFRIIKSELDQFGLRIYK
jgi:flotillin